MTDPITEMLNHIRSAQAVARPEISVPFSQLKHNIAEIFAAEGFVAGVKKGLKKENKVLKITLKYNSGVPAIVDLKRISKPGQRIYSSAADLKAVRGGRGIAIVSTPKGLMTNKRARKENVGGEIICEVW